MFEESNSKIERRGSKEKAIASSHGEDFSLRSPQTQTMEKECTDIIEDAFNPIKCTTWQSKKNLLDRIEEDHPTHKSIEYNIVEKMTNLPPIGKGLLGKNTARSILLNSIKMDAIPSVPVEAHRDQFFEDISTFAKKRSIAANGNVVCAISKDQEGSRFIQKKLDTASEDEINMTFLEILPWISELIVDLFGNYVVQKFLEIGSTEQRERIFGAMEDMIIPLALHMYGCRVIQKALECKDINEMIVQKIKGHVIDLVCDQNGNHVVQKCVECVDTDFVIKEFEEDAVSLSKHRYGCRVIQRIFENSTRCTSAIEKIISNAKALVEDQYGNYVIQHILEKGTQDHKVKIITELSGNIAEYSIHKFASNVMEKCVICGTPDDRRHMLKQLRSAVGASGEDMLVQISMDKFGNYVIQRLLDVLTGPEKELLVGHLKANIGDLKKSSYTKCIVSKIAALDIKKD
ncbi:pumilio RNA-binding family [Nematocida major]|uniref:pumilio RNA-binding family n=1 Tax=Nematocida major TaxID=1912982 RepID=UPI0020083DC0|nr:pumilio RNA-binding family [Nematocida major]KAH9386259.1 pumilio RNA-binding family [Nematocida major]